MFEKPWASSISVAIWKDFRPFFNQFIIRLNISGKGFINSECYRKDKNK